MVILDIIRELEAEWGFTPLPVDLMGDPLDYLQWLLL